MHKGRTYPYLPEYFGTEYFFWPGFVPWKVVLHPIGTSGPPPPPWYYGPQVVSEPGSIEYDAGGVRWVFYYDPSDHSNFMQLSILPEAIPVPGMFKWQLDLALGDFFVATAGARQTIPQRVFHLTEFQWWNTIGAPPITPGPWYDMAPAVYAVGGSPWIGPG